ncbi:hypothetical protein [Myxococcus xanthus]|uniref:hypothetical protein n=1 Tax=Myxococcus xanthus TaxID=34 RepID=UPI0002EC9A93|nr:hypothetical protein [Myxococcus xanthus]QPM78526.1 hypothetical protein I5Q59_30280 [Myxococcus xanthus]QVW67594.1 hypothetical protein JTM82_35630 [Myxococcus xanthus DZ2]UEO06279.1 hypothetical protein K1515_07160 [Myxococcus xanthus DZ2]
MRPFSTVEELRRALLEWAQRYNEHWLLERHHFLSPSQARRELMQSKQAADYNQPGVSTIRRGTMAR